MTNFELQQLRDLPIEGVAERLGLSVVRHKCLCPFHNDHHESLSFSVRRNSFRCFACDTRGGTIDLVMGVMHLDFLAACRWLGGDSMIAPLPAPATIRSAPKEQRPFDAGRYEPFFLHPHLNEVACHFLFEVRQLDPRVVRWCRLTSWRDRRGTDWLQIPYFSRSGLLVGVQFRNLVPGAVPRFRFPSGSHCGIYNLPVLERLQPHDELFIAEGSSDCWALLSAGHKAIAIPSATLLSQEDIALLTALHQERSICFHMFPDRDEPGERLFLQLQAVLPSLQHHQLPPSCKDFSDYFIQSKK